METKSFKIPKGLRVAKMEVIDGCVVTTFEQEFKRGDICFTDNEACKMVYIYQSDGDDEFVVTYIAMTYDGMLRLDGWLESENKGKKNQSFATPEQAQLLFDALAKDGKKWNAEKECIEPLKVDPRVGDYVKMSRATFHGFVFAKLSGTATNRYYYDNRIADGVAKNSPDFWIIDNNTIVENFGTNLAKFQSEVAKNGFEYDPENDSYSKLRRKPELNEPYFSLSYGPVLYWYDDKSDNFRFDNNLIFKTPEARDAFLIKIKDIER